MSYQRIKQPKLADTIAAKIEQMIVEGSLQPGQRLLPERELAEQFAVSRPSVREAIQQLEARGLVSRRQGGGTYVQNALTKGLADPLFQLLAEHPESQYDLLEFRHTMEGISAFYAAMRGTEADFDSIREAQQAIVRAQEKGDLPAEAKAAAEFYLAVAAAAHNVVLLHLLRAIQPMLESSILRNIKILNRRAGMVERIRVHRANLIQSILSREPEQARDACHEHLAFIEETLLDIQREETRIQRSLRRHRQQE
ncbi:pyruvate dehydrogenase complex transcriptional repressor PdhR [Oceanisphaera psychrotolerans]|uniref:Pyruvate dehydrogenase complex repressor n=1 Tax=Oceanisphaera psychrotolerans TaxID=1414654 RepID=A0A1J4QHQ4_9GAMM|nr:pyruvate dehydrogenase complex transcriptional repressor PdhR [Oceanisphaera psychrotolerans]OIN12396.1 transcriptional regulator PdhR [Oceanisphaera psychrotolerans]